MAGASDNSESGTNRQSCTSSNNNVQSTATSSGGKAGKNLAEYLIAGGIAGMVSRTCIAPIERVKIVYQISQKSRTKSYTTIPPQIWREEGFFAFWNGNSAAVVRVVPYMSIQFMTYEIYKRNLTDPNVWGLVNTVESLGAPPPTKGILFHSGSIVTLTAGSLAGLTAVATTYPLDTVRARMAVMQNTPKGTLTATTIIKPYKSMIDAVMTIAREEGFAALYRGVGATLIGVSPYCGLKFACYEAMKDLSCAHLGIAHEVDLPAEWRVASGSMAGLFALTFVYPFDVIRRRMQTSRGPTPLYNGVLHAFYTIGRNEGIVNGLYRGMSLNYIKTLPNVAIYMSLYDVIKNSLIHFQRQD